jgi:hypothetical protein
MPFILGLLIWLQTGYNFQVLFLLFQTIIYLYVLISGDMLANGLVLEIGTLFSLSGEMSAHSYVPVSKPADEPGKQVSSAIKIKNVSSTHVAFKVSISPC